jgi:hypothetical protein
MLDYVLYGGLFLTLLVLGMFSFYVQDYDFIIQNPGAFFSELIAVGLLPALLMVFVFSITRKLSPNETLVWFFTVLLKLMILHLLLQLSGCYSYMFGTR